MRTSPSLDPTQTVSDLVAQHPTTLPVLARHGVDLCCGGSRTLEFVAQAHRLDLAELLDELARATRSPDTV